MVEHDELQTATGVQRHLSHHLERLSDRVHVFVAQQWLLEHIVVRTSVRSATRFGK